MPRPTQRDVHVNRPLTNISVAYTNANYIAEQVFPMVGVQKQSDLYFLFDKWEAFRLRTGPRPPGQRAPTFDYTVTTASYICTNDSTAFQLPDETRDNADDPLRPFIFGAKRVADGLLLSLEDRVAALVTACGNWGSASNPGTKWDVTTAGIWSDMDTQVNAVSDSIGKPPNVMVISDHAWRACRNNADLLDRVKYTRNGATIEPTDLMGWFNLDKVLIGRAQKVTTREGETQSFTKIWGDMCWVGYVTPQAALEEPTAGYVFRWGNKKVERFREGPEHADLLQAEWFTDEVIVASDAGAIFSDVTSN